MKKFIADFVYWLRQGYSPVRAWQLAKKTL